MVLCENEIWREFSHQSTGHKTNQDYSEVCGLAKNDPKFLRNSRKHVLDTEQF